jgi:hypothetical protein
MSLEVPRGRPGKETAPTDVAEQSVTETADKQPLTTAEAERLTTRIGLKLGILADTYESVMPLIREAIDRNAHIALGYPSFGAYAAGRFSDSLSRLGVDMRRDVVKELTAAGMSTRAIAPIVGVSKDTVNRDQAAVSHETPSSEDAAVTEITPDSVTGIDGKEYTRPSVERQPRQSLPKMESEIMAHLDRLAKRGHHHHIQRVINYAQGLLDSRSAADLTPEMFDGEVES